MKFNMKFTIFIFLSSLAMFGSHSIYASCNANMPVNKPNTIYSDHGDGTVTDAETSLMWQKCSIGLSGSSCTGVATVFTWKAALNIAQTANSGVGTFGYKDWRLPSVAELRTLVEYACSTPAINVAIFPGTVGGYYWTSSPYIGNNIKAWTIYFEDGGEGQSNNDKYFTHNVRLVRGGL